MRARIYRFAWFAGLAVMVTLACNLSEAGRQIGSAGETAQAIIGEGQQLIGTLQSFATQHAPFIATAQAFVTQEGSRLAETAKAFATQNAPLLATAQALATEKGPEMLQTVQAAATQFAGGQTSADIPTVPRETTTNFFASQEVVSYSTTMPYAKVLEFYQTAMISNGWTEMRDEWKETQNAAVLTYQKSNRSALISLSVLNNMTSVLIKITTK